MPDHPEWYSRIPGASLEERGPGMSPRKAHNFIMGVLT